jgi:hypothetical protein
MPAADLATESAPDAGPLQVALLPGPALAAPAGSAAERVAAMVSPAELLYGRAAPSEGNRRRPLYKQAWFWGVLGVAATGVATGITAAVLTTGQSPHASSAIHPLILSTGPS